jgi:uncharacterized protein (DUF1697 family)
VRTHVVLLRGVNVGGHNRVPMADLRGIATALGHSAVATYLNSGNLVMATERTDTVALAAEFAAAIEDRLGLRIEVVVLSRAQLGELVAGNPYGEPADAKTLHLALRQGPMPAARRAVIEREQQRAAGGGDAGGGDVARIVGDTLYLLTPAGIARSDLAARLGRGPDTGTARNWTTVTNLLALLDEAT